MLGKKMSPRMNSGSTARRKNQKYGHFWHHKPNSSFNFWHFKNRAPSLHAERYAACRDGARFLIYLKLKEEFGLPTQTFSLRGTYIRSGTPHKAEVTRFDESEQKFLLSMQTGLKKWLITMI